MTAMYADHYEFRAELLSRLRSDLLGPAGPDDELLVDAPITTYVMGILFPPSEEKQNLVADDDSTPVDVKDKTEDALDTGVAMANVQMPTSMGMTFAVVDDPSSLVSISVDAAVYEPVDLDGNRIEPKRADRRSTEDDGVRWRRRRLPTSRIEFAADGEAPERITLAEGLELRLRVRPPMDGKVSITATLVNVTKFDPSKLRDPHCFFQPVIKVNGALIERPGPGGGDEREVVSNRLLYRYAPTFAVGHGCSVEWDWTPPSPSDLFENVGRAEVPEVRTTFVPWHEVLLTDSNPDIPSDSLGMMHLATAEDAEVIRALTALEKGYRAWIDVQRKDSERLVERDFRGRAEEHLDRCDEAAERISNGVNLLRKRKDALRAFKLANEAMAQQRGRSSWIKKGRKGKVVLDGEWRPFQIAFLLQCLDGIYDPEHQDRKTVDLLWFPTGGGKTEAYLGLIAFTVFLRRIRNGHNGGGVTAIMRYTLRLLTLQQFERAAALICAMEVLRRKPNREIPGEEISLGMWVGQAATPNDLASAEAQLGKLRKGDKVQAENPVQLRGCPWCGVAMDAWNYTVDQEQRTMTVACRSDECPFHSGLPVHVIDETLYEARPTLIIATSDKFARMPWRADVARLFNCDTEFPPVELIVQDELHLISGPLGSLAGLYETVVDEVAQRPKVIASTATIRRAAEQGRALFDREVAQFPPPGLDARDSWFAVQASRDKKASRLYVGVITPNTSQASLLVRTYAALLHHAANIDGSDAVRDAYWTLVGYFNSLRLLAAADLQVRDDVRERLKLLAKDVENDAREAELVCELTSRIESSDIPKYLEDLLLSLPDKATLDVVLATNMISVGVDVDRLGLMAIMGQPQTTAEYIQSSSRVGRSYPGLVVTMFNAARSRDRSHYENFQSYHSALYRQVESSSVTPFSSRARDRALHAVLVALVRLMIPDLRENEAAARVDEFLPQIEELKSLVLSRVSRVAPEERQGTSDQLDDILEWWCRLAEQNPELVYEARRPDGYRRKREPDAALLRNFTDDDLTDAFDTLWSLRDVDATSNLYLER
ncbi:helicase-related protein [Lentzea sp. NPDC003310]|uniref:helicase-related protein n=1 Tax=Lentzea sp. NPDC003310 TaxID=3154447 RepID=UPI00339E1C33